ncbi:MAG: hypothetical protein ACP5I1_08755, partial [Candidatus Hinthialibacter sp.]
MSPHTEINASIYDPDGQSLLADAPVPRKCMIKSGFGAQKRSCWLELFNEDLHLPIHLGFILNITINGESCFTGPILQRRIDSIDDHLSCYAEFDPSSKYDRLLHAAFENRAILEILQEILAGSGLILDCPGGLDASFKRLEFTGDSLFRAIDLLAKLAGNWHWDVLDGGTLRLRPPSALPDYQIALQRDDDVVNLWETSDDLFTEILIAGGVNQGSTYDWTIRIPALEDSVLDDAIRIYIRSLADSDAFEALRRAIVNQMKANHYEHYIDLMGRGETIQPGQTVKFFIDNLPLFPQEQIFRVKSREITYAHESLQT